MSIILSRNMSRLLFVLCVFILFLFSPAAYAQKSKADSVSKLLALEKVDSNRVSLMWHLAGYVNIYNPDTAILLSQKALYLAREIKYADGEARSLGALANAFKIMGNYPRALELYFMKLKMVEKGNNPRDLAVTLITIGTAYTLQEEYQYALENYRKADSVIQVNQIENLKYYILLNLGDVYNRLNINDSAYNYFKRSLEVAKILDDVDLIGTSMTGLGHSYLKMGKYQESLLNYQTAINCLQTANDFDLLCEASLGLAKLYEQIGKKDSAAYNGTFSYTIAKESGLLPHQLEAAEFLADHYKINKNIDSAFVYISQVKVLNDTVNSKSRVRESQILSMNEKLRQLEIAESKRIAAKERAQQLQLLSIGIFIPGFFLFTLLLSRIRINIRAIKVLGILSLLILFEYLTLLLHPTVAELTHHTPILEILIFVAIAAILIPAHHRIEHWLIERLIRNRVKKPTIKIPLKSIRIKMKNVSE